MFEGASGKGCANKADKSTPCGDEFPPCENANNEQNKNNDNENNSFFAHIQFPFVLRKIRFFGLISLSHSTPVKETFLI
jgi:hypothetical protein